MPATKSRKPGERSVLLLVGTTKGAFLLRGDRRRRRFDVSGPHFPGHSVYALAYDGRAGKRRIWAGAKSSFFGVLLRSSDDFGKTWTEPGTAGVKFPPDTGASIENIWQITPGRSGEPDTIYCGVQPAALFESRDAGVTWTLARGLWDHPHRPRWEPGFGGLCLHTIVPHPADRQRMHVAVSAAGVYRTDDGGRSWRTSHKGVRADFRPDKHPEFGQCVHKVVLHPSRPDTLFLQNHWGLYRTDDGGDGWRDIANGVPSDFGFAMAIHPRDPDTVYIVPLKSDEFRCVPEAKLRVYRTHDGGRSWKALASGLPQKGAYETVLRDALTLDALEPAGVYFGTRSGKIYGSADEGNRWRLVLDGLPPVVCVKAAEIDGPPGGRRAAPIIPAVRGG